MYAFIQGRLAAITMQSCIILAGGIGYKIFIAPTTSGKLPDIGKEALLHTSFIVRELSQTLYGFHAEQERDTFELLLGITGIGPKLALSIVGHLPPQDLQCAVLGNDIRILSKIPGIGKKTAERLIIEMRDKLQDILPLPSAAHFAIDTKTPQSVLDAISALTNLGYTYSAAQKAVQKSVETLPEDVDLAKLITQALKHV